LGNGALEVRKYLTKLEGTRFLVPFEQHTLFVETGYYDGSYKCPDYNLQNSKGVCVHSFDLKCKEKVLGERTTINSWFRDTHERACRKYPNYAGSIVNYFKPGMPRRYRIIEA
jgi:hypothetical protein